MEDGATLTLATPCDVYMVSASTLYRRRRVLWRMSVGDAMKLCSRKETAGQDWMLVWTTRELDNPDFAEFVDDDGRFTGLIEGLGITVLKSKAMEAVR